MGKELVVYYYPNEKMAEAAEDYVSEESNEEKRQNYYNSTVKRIEFSGSGTKHLHMGLYDYFCGSQRELRGY